jgi:hypothetical protein
MVRIGLRPVLNAPEAPRLYSPYLGAAERTGNNGQDSRVFGVQLKRRKQIAVGEKVPLDLTGRERDLIVKHTFAGSNLTDRLRIEPSPGRRPSYRFTLDDLDELAGYVAAEANHAEVKKLENELRRLYGRIAEVLESYTDEHGK